MKSLILAVVLSIVAGSSMAQIAVVVHKDNPMDDISLAELKRIYMGKRTLFPNKERILLGEYAPSTEQFYHVVVRRTPRSLRQYWIKLIFNGESATPPRGLTKIELMREFVATNTGAICFVDASLVTEDLKVLRVEGHFPDHANYAIK